MRFKVDESLHVEVADLLRGQGRDALTVFDQGLRGRSDHDIADKGNRGQALVFRRRHVIQENVGAEKEDRNDEDQH